MKSIKHEIPLFKVFMSKNVDTPLLGVINSGYIGEGPKVSEFESQLAKLTGNDKVLTVNSGTSALHLAYHLALYQDEFKSYKNSGISEIITTPITCTATNTPIITNGAKIIWADVDPITGSISPDDVERKITKNTKAIVMVHWGGNPCEISRINEIAEKYGIKTVEDCAHSMGMKYNNEMFGNQSSYSACSFQAIKHITSVDGGALFFENKDDYDRAKLLRWYGIDRTIREGLDLRCEMDVAEAGYKFHMNDVCAVIGNENLKHLDEILNRHRENAYYYNKVFSDAGVSFIPENKDGKSAYWLYTIHADNRDELMIKLKENGIMSSKVHARNDTHSMFAEFKADLPNAGKFNATHLCIPVGWWVTDEQREYIAQKVIEYIR